MRNVKKVVVILFISVISLAAEKRAETPASTAASLAVIKGELQKVKMGFEALHDGLEAFKEESALRATALGAQQRMQTDLQTIQTHVLQMLGAYMMHACIPDSWHPTIKQVAKINVALFCIGSIYKIAKIWRGMEA